MKFLRTLLLIILSLVILIVVVGLFLPSASHVERSTIIKQSPGVVFNQVNTLKNWEKWSPWHKLDTNMLLTYTGPESGVGSTYQWKSKQRNVGNGTLIIVESHPDSFINTSMEFEGMGKSNASYKFEKAPDGTKVTWAMDSKGEGMPWYMTIPHRYFGLFMDGMVGPDFERGLNNMKEVAEKMPATGNYKIEEVTTDDQMAILIHGKAEMSDISAKLGMLYGKLGAYAGKHGAKTTGHPFAIYHSAKGGHFVFEAGIPVDKKIASSKDIKFKEMKAGKAIKADYYGDYMGMGRGHRAIKEWMKTNDKKLHGAPWEVYVTDPMAEKDSTKWLSEIYYPI
jgi:effector-binding domain-containing protein